MAALGALIAWFAAATLIAVLVGALIQRPAYAVAMAVIGLLTWAYARWTRSEPVEAPQKPAERPQTAPWRIQASHVPESWGEPDGRWIVVPDQEPRVELEDHGMTWDEAVMVGEYLDNLREAGTLPGPVRNREPKPTKRKPIVWNPARVKPEAVPSRPVRPEDVPPTHPMRVWFEQAGLPWPPS
jgi:hypothetical protein